MTTHAAAPPSSESARTSAPTSAAPTSAAPTSTPPGTQASTLRANLRGKPMAEQEQMLAPTTPAAPASEPSEKRRGRPRAPITPDPEFVRRQQADAIAGRTGLPGEPLFVALNEGLDEAAAIVRVRTLMETAPTIAAELGHAEDHDIIELVRGYLANGMDRAGIAVMLQADIRATPSPRAAVPFTARGWDARAILNVLGQYDQASSTVEDPFRCVQAVALASHILQGPDDTIAYLRDVLSQPNQVVDVGDPDRVPHAQADLQRAIAAIQGRSATFADLSLAQDAAHRIRYAPVSSTRPEDCLQQIDPNGARANRTVTSMHVWCNSTAELMTMARGLAPGEQLVVDEVAMRLNAVFHDYEDEHRGQHPRSVNIADDAGHQRAVSRVNERQRPAPARLDEQRDQHQGHQLLIFRDSDNALVYYDPERNNAAMGEVHTADLESSTRPIDTIFARDRPGTYNYYLVMGQIRTQREGAAAAATSAPR